MVSSCLLFVELKKSNCACAKYIVAMQVVQIYEMYAIVAKGGKELCFMQSL